MESMGGGREQSAHLFRLALVLARAAEVFDEFDSADAWIKEPIPALGGVTPLSLLYTESGAERVLDTLGRIEHGVFA
jgi:putative toxin-antitoxin system antitoxin component (TIGR02293 family)